MKIGFGSKPDAILLLENLRTAQNKGENGLQPEVPYNRGSHCGLLHHNRKGGLVSPEETYQFIQSKSQMGFWSPWPPLKFSSLLLPLDP